VQAPSVHNDVASAPVTDGLVVHWAARYDLLVRLLTLGRERPFRERLLGPANLQPGESVLDVGCGTGTLALLAKRRVAPTGTVTGIDASPEMIARARRKAARARQDVSFRVAAAEALPFADASFDVVLSTVMLHQLPRATRQLAVREMKRVINPNGRVLCVDFVRSNRRGLLAHFHKHGRVSPHDLIELVTNAGLTVGDSGAIGAWDLQYVVGR
jgi:ubiquinone/menaquinone biosynthesis C-methylase UbiE